jgi:hypothetical protein
MMKNRSFGRLLSLVMLASACRQPPAAEVTVPTQAPRRRRA